MSNYTIEQITTMLAQSSIEQSLLKKLKKDPRKGVVKLIDKYEKQQEEIIESKQKLEEMSKYEEELYMNGYEFIAGVDEVGRGPLAGPVIAAAVILPRNIKILGINDSKQLTEKKRIELFEQIKEQAIEIGIGIIPAHLIDEVNIYQATKLAMMKAVTQLKRKPQYLLIDAMKLETTIPQLSLIKGDEKSVSIAASSIIAKVTRDRYMKTLGSTYPSYGFQNHMGYGTKQHLEAISNFGIISEHRKSFAPIKDVIENS